MVKEGLEKILPIMQAFVEGKTIQRYDDKKDDWYDVSSNANIDFCYDYRIKTEQTYRPFKNQEECWNEMLKHQPFGWVKEISSEMLYLINGISDMSIVIMEDISSFKEAMNIYEFKDGAPFGVMEE